MSEGRVLKYGDFTADFNTLPETSLVAMLRRGFAHFMGSEQASKVTGYFDPENAAEDGSTLADTPENRAAKKAEYQGKAMEALVAGTVGISTRQPAVDPITKVIRRLATADVKVKLENAKLAWPKKADDVIKFPNGQELTAAVLVDRQVAKKLEEYTKDAKKIIADQQKKAEAAKVKAQAEGLDDLLT